MLTSFGNPSRSSGNCLGHVNAMSPSEGLSSGVEAAVDSFWTHGVARRQVRLLDNFIPVYSSATTGSGLGLVIRLD